MIDPSENEIQRLKQISKRDGVELNKLKQDLRLVSEKVTLLSRRVEEGKEKILTLAKTGGRGTQQLQNSYAAVSKGIQDVRKTAAERKEGIEKKAKGEIKVSLQKRKLDLVGEKIAACRRKKHLTIESNRFNELEELYVSKRSVRGSQQVKNSVSDLDCTLLECQTRQITENVPPSVVDGDARESDEVIGIEGEKDIVDTLTMLPILSENVLVNSPHIPATESLTVGEYKNPAENVSGNHSEKTYSSNSTSKDKDSGKPPASKRLEVDLTVDSGKNSEAVRLTIEEVIPGRCQMSEELTQMVNIFVSGTKSFNRASLRRALEATLGDSKIHLQTLSLGKK